ncbi:MAG: prepilin-type N-terminal cleavage/methylation domain-containing protein [Gemmatimonadaceae bacterium]
MRRAAFSLAELLVALVLLAVGLAACVRAASAVARLEGDAGRRRRVAEVLRARLDSLAATACGPDAGDHATSGGVTEDWQATSDGRRWQLVVRVAAIGRPALARTWTASVRCPR